MFASTIKHWAMLEHILCYLERAPKHGILYNNHAQTGIACFVDTDWAKSKIDRISTTVYCGFIDGSLISWRNKKQNVVDAKLEYSSMTLSTHEIMWIQHMLTEIGLEH